MRYNSKLLAVYFLFPICLTAQDRKPLPVVGEFKIVSREIAEKDDSLCVDILFSLDKITLKSCQSLMVYPTIEQGARKVEFPPLLLNGRMNHIEWLRNQRLSSQVALGYVPVGTLPVHNKKENTYRYSYRIPYQYSWMDSARVYLSGTIIDCAGGTKASSHRLLTDSITLGERLPASPYRVNPQIAFVTPEVEAVKDREEKGEAYLDFPVGKAVILPDFKKNPEELQKVHNVISSIKNDSNITIKDITIRGYASIDGSMVTNQRLSHARAQSLRDYLAHTYNLPFRQFKVSGEGEDWSQLLQLVNNSGYDNAKELADIITSPENNDRKESRLKAYKGGDAYRKIAADLFPKLRRAQYVINYSIRSFTLDEGRKVVFRRPALLSQNEMFLVANSYGTGTENFNKIFDIAVRLFPDSKAARINAAAIALQKEDTRSAAEFLKEITDSPEAVNNRGVMHLLKGELDEAEQEFLQAKELGSRQAAHNLNEVTLKRKDNELFQRLSHKK